MTVRLLVVASAATAGTRELVFGGEGEPLDVAAVDRLVGRTAGWWCGPEPTCAVTGRALGGEPEVVAAFAGPDVGRWRGRSLAEVAAAEPEAARAWLADVAAAPHGGESLADLATRVGGQVEAHRWPEGRSVVVVVPLVARALAVHALAAPASVLLRLDVAPLDRLTLTRGPGGWRLRLAAP
ncbi:MAG: histidine phosphatase family protein [Actinomycetes bacterium]